MNTKVKKSLKIALIFVLGLAVGLLLNSGKKENKKETDKVQTGQTNDSVDYWTCSMHPQIHADGPGKCPICGMDLIPANTGSAGSVPNKMETMLSEDAVKLAQIQTTKVEYAKPEKKLILQGMIMPDETKIYSQSIHFDGRIEKIFVNYEGQKVSKGQKIAVIYSPDLVTAQQEFLQAVQYKESNPLMYEAAKNKLKFWKLTDNQIENLEKNKKIIENFTLLSENSGFISKINAKAGDYVKSGQMLFEVTDLSTVWVIFDAYEKDLPFIKVGDEIEFTTADNETYKTKISFISPLINPQKRTYDVRGKVNNSGGKLKTGMFVQGIINAKLNIKDKILIVPKSAVLWTGQRSIVYVKVSGKTPPTYALRIVELGNDLGAYYEIKSGLNEGEEVVTNGAFTIDAAAELAGNYSMLNLPEDNIPQNIGKIELDDDTKNILNQILDAYDILTDDLVSASSEMAAVQAQKIHDLAQKINVNKIPESVRKDFEEQLNIIIQQSENMVKMNNIDMQRKHFQYVSEALIKIEKSVKSSDKKRYVQFCPMYNNNNGAFWISDIKEIKNPYYGSQMLTCGETKDSIM